MILKNCNSCIIYEPDSESEILLKARVRCMEDKITLHFEDENGLSEHTDRLRIDFCDSQIGYIKTFSELEVRKNSDPYILEPWIADCKILETIEILQRQQELRVRMAKEVGFMSENHGRFTGTVQNISVGGFYLTTNKRLGVGDHVEFEYSFMKKPQEVQASILRETVIKDGYFGYGCQFANLPKGAERDIRQFVYRQQLNKMS
ncbi:MAG: PilZ domain-containing protein [Dorea sp.]|uniref:PilZ domain-containing protein n=1 Tax=Sporofaciens musculi TaxID=2681861 RepID=UPI002170C7AF|nr:PilZ domain-containing protein [Sporofaciens musculi]MCI9422031.1 PilZ domain-containing protein [Dorea sp.]